MQIVQVVIVCVIFSAAGVACQDLHVIDAKPGQCFRVHNPDQPQLYLNPRRPEYDDLYESCTQWLRENKNCLGLRTQNGEVLIIYCKDDQKRRRRGCYKMINKNKREEVICQRLNKRKGCEVINTRTNLTIVVHCNPNSNLTPSGSPGLLDVKDNRPRRQ